MGLRNHLHQKGWATPRRAALCAIITLVSLYMLYD